eukprot:EG_transcript_17001
MVQPTPLVFTAAPQSPSAAFEDDDNEDDDAPVISISLKENSGASRHPPEPLPSEPRFFQDSSLFIQFTTDPRPAVPMLGGPPLPLPPPAPLDLPSVGGPPSSSDQACGPESCATDQDDPGAIVIHGCPSTSSSSSSTSSSSDSSDSSSLPFNGTLPRQPRPQPGLPLPPPPDPHQPAATPAPALPPCGLLHSGREPTGRPPLAGLAEALHRAAAVEALRPAESAAAEQEAAEAQKWDVVGSLATTLAQRHRTFPDDQETTMFLDWLQRLQLAHHVVEESERQLRLCEVGLLYERAAFSSKLQAVQKYCCEALPAEGVDSILFKKVQAAFCEDPPTSA